MEELNLEAKSEHSHWSSKRLVAYRFYATINRLRLQKEKKKMIIIKLVVQFYRHCSFA